MKEPSSIKLNQEQYNELSRRLERNELTAEDRVVLGQVLKAMIWLSQQLEAGRLHIARLKRLVFGKKTESRKNILPDHNGAKSGQVSTQQNNKGTDFNTQQNKDCDQNTENKNTNTDSRTQQNEHAGNDAPRTGHGRYGHEQYTGAEKIICKHPNLKVGDVCPDCGKGKLHNSVKPGIFIQFIGSPLISGTIYETEKLRCGLCGKLFEAPLPAGITAEKWTESANTIFALSRYGYGLPFFRLERFQENIGIPVSDSVAFEQANKVADCGLPIYRTLVNLAAQGKLIHYDDTTARILELMKENKTRNPATDRVGMFTTAVISRVEDKEIPLFFTGRNHAGENMAELLKKRANGLDPPILMSDGSANNPPKGFETILGNCLTHGRRGFVDLEKQFPKEIQYVIDLLAKIYHSDAIAKERAMNDGDRLCFHQDNSGPLIEELKQWCHEQIENKMVEPNGPLGKAIKYMQKRWDKLTLFLKIPGAPLSNDIVERMIKTYVLHRKNSLFYKTMHGAAVGDILMTLIHSAVRAKENPLNYLNELQRHRRQVYQNPEAWLPWNYKATLGGTSSPHA